MTLDLAIRVTCLLALGAGVGRLMSPAAASTRHGFRRLVIVMALVLPPLTWVAPGWSVPRIGGERAATLEGSQTAPSADALLVWDLPAAAQGLEQWAPLGRTIWLCGGALVLAYLSMGYLFLWQVRRRSAPAPAAWQTAAARLSHRLGIRPVPEVRVSGQLRGPLVAGVFRPAVLVPLAAADWSRARRDATLLHELAHVQRRDLQTQGMAQLLCAIHWFNPLAWLSARALRREQELCCDDEVLRHGVPAADYASELLAIAAAALGGHEPAAALPMARASDMEGRLLSMLGDRRRHSGRTARVLAPLAAVLLGTLAAGASTAAPANKRWSGLTGRYVPAVQHPAWSVVAPGGDRASTAGEVDDQLAASDPVARERAIRILALTPGDDVVPALLEALADPASRVREQAAAGLAWRQHPDIVPSLMDAAADPVAAVREKALVALALSGDDRARDAVDAARIDPDPSVRDKARKLARLR